MSKAFDSWKIVSLDLESSSETWRNTTYLKEWHFDTMIAWYINVIFLMTRFFWSISDHSSYLYIISIGNRLYCSYLDHERDLYYGYTKDLLGSKSAIEIFVWKFLIQKKSNYCLWSVTRVTLRKMIKYWICLFFCSWTDSWYWSKCKYNVNKISYDTYYTLD